VFQRHLKNQIRAFVAKIMSNQTLNYLKTKGLISEESFERIAAFEKGKPFSIHWHIRTLLYLGITLLAAGLGILVYQNIDSIGHITILSLIGITSAFCIFYTFRKAPAFERTQVKDDNSWLDYVLLFGVLTFLSFEGYLQYQYNIFGLHYGLATLIPSAILLFLAYRFDHQGVLNMGLTLFASALGLSLSFKEILSGSSLESDTLISSGLILSVIFSLVGMTGKKQNLKAHFEFSYYHYALHLAGVSIISAIIYWPFYLIWLLPLAGFLYLVYKYALSAKSFYLASIGIIYTYIGLSAALIRVVSEATSTDEFVFIMYYFIFSGVGFIYLLNKMRKQINRP